MTYLLTLASWTPGLPRFLKSLDNLNNFEHIKVDLEPFPGHIKKWESLPKGLDEDRYIVFSDTDDVIFQKDLPEFTHDVYLAPENVTHRDTIWKSHIERYPQFAPLMDREVYNCGTFAMKVKTLYEYAAFMMEFEDGGYRKENLEQMYFNMFIHTRQELSRVIDLSIFCPLYRNVHNRLAVKTDRGWCTNNRLISVVHANGSGFLKQLL
jgi:hypothetical protein